MKRWLFLLLVFVTGAAAVWRFALDAEVASDELLEGSKPGLIEGLRAPGIGEPEGLGSREQSVDPTEDREIADRTVPSAAAARPLSEEEEFAKLYGAMSVKELQREVDRLMDELAQADGPIFEQRFAAGIYEVVAYGPKHEYTYP